ncbi:hypothetical protein EGW08_001572 [Elysia chlorotica]|uniref:Tyrosine specific protein phosphatases domain-containing protein n=1 Tax=Elysia chlorotica TaxID=188477 RepID=A0A433UA54_ELYCH|nr:hypothetical protein EGW08_001572 [Elysia chlorotica]
MRSLDFSKLVSLLGLSLALSCFTSHLASVNAEPSRRRGDLEFPESSYDVLEPRPYYSESLFQEQQDEASRCDNSTIGEASSCPNPLITTLYGDPYVAFDRPFSQRKMWFTRRLKEGVYVAGQLTPRQIKYAADSGFKSIVTTFDHDGKGEGMTFKITTDQEENLVKLAGMKFFRILRPNEYNDWTKVLLTERMGRVYPKVELPALFHCERGVAVTMSLLLHFAKEYKGLSGGIPKIDSQRFYELTKKHGLDFADLLAPMTEATVEEVLGAPKPSSATKPFLSVPMWFDYWQAHPVAGNWFMAGQIVADDLPTIKSTGFITVLNVRQGLKHKSAPAQENAELINIKSDTPTYDKDGNPLRQRKETLKTLIIDNGKKSRFIGPGSLTNYESENPEEFGDKIGYNEQLEREALESAGIGYTHLPLAGKA